MIAAAVAAAVAAAATAAVAAAAAVAVVSRCISQEGQGSRSEHVVTDRQNPTITSFSHE